jgi:hypothetical protein
MAENPWTVTDAITSVTVTSGTDDAYPSVQYQKGLWFDGSDYAEITGLVLNQQFTLTLWVRVSVGGDGTVFFIGTENFSEIGSENWLDIYCANGRFTVDHGQDTVDTDFLFSVTEDANDFIYEDWYQIALKVDWDNIAKEGTASLYRNSVFQASTDFTLPFDDRSTYSHLLGAK